MDVHFWLWIVITVLLISVMIACSLPRSVVPLKYKKAISWIPLLLFAKLVFTHDLAAYGLAWVIVFGGAKLMFTDHEFWRPAGRVIMIIGVAGVLGTGAHKSTQGVQPAQAAAVQQH